MEQTMFYKHVSSWIDSYYNAEALEWLHRFVNNSPQEGEIKERLHMEIDRKIASLTDAPFFCKYDGMEMLMDETLKENQHPKVFTTRYAALNKVIELRTKGYDARLVEGNAFYRIQLVQPAPIDIRQPADELTMDAAFGGRRLRLSA